MKKTARAFLIYTITPWILLAYASPAFTEEAQRYTNESFARLSHISGTVFIQRAAEMGSEEGEINMPISEGDRIGTMDGRAEIYIHRGKFIRLDHNTKIDFLKLQDKTNDIIQLRIWSGNVYVHAQRLEEEKNIEVHTTDVSLYILDRGTYRIDVRENMETEVFVFSGVLEAALDTGSFLVKDEQRIEAIDGRSTSKPSGFIVSIEDSFDKWNYDRDQSWNIHLAERRLPDDLEDFENELEEYGDWAYEESYGNVWIPGGVGPGWIPYTNGRWIWLASSGWTWLPYEPWGWVTSHYGRWHWNSGWGWYWIPTNLWGPAWVSWYSGSDYWAWAPMSYYGHPGVIINNRYYPRHTGYYPLDSRAVTFVRRDQIQSHNISGISLKPDEAESLSRINLTSKRPDEQPLHRTTMQDLGGERKILKKSSAGMKKSNPPDKMRAPSIARAIRRDSGNNESTERKIRKNGIDPSSPVKSSTSRSKGIGSTSSARKKTSSSAARRTSPSKSSSSAKASSKKAKKK